MLLPDERRGQRNLLLAQRDKQSRRDQVRGRAGIAGVVVRAQESVKIQEGSPALGRVEAAEAANLAGVCLYSPGFVIAKFAKDEAIPEIAQKLELDDHNRPFDILKSLGVVDQHRRQTMNHE